MNHPITKTDKPPATPKSTSMPEPLTHYHPDNDPETVYRVVGTQDSVTLLQVTKNGRRSSIGNITQVNKEELRNEYTEAGNPDKQLNPPPSHPRNHTGPHMDAACDMVQI